MLQEKIKIYRERKYNHGSLFNSEVSNKYIHNNVNIDCWFYQKLLHNYIGGTGEEKEQVLNYDTRKSNAYYSLI